MAEDVCVERQPGSMQGGHGKRGIPTLVLAGQRDVVAGQWLIDEFQRRADLVGGLFQHQPRGRVLRR